VARARARTTGIAPPPTCRPSVHSHTVSPPYFGFELPIRTMFRPRGFAPPRRFPPLGGSQACCILLPILGFAVFPAPCRHHHYRSSGWIDRHVPRRRVSYPPKDSPHLQPRCVTTAVASLPFFLRFVRAAPPFRCQNRAYSRTPRRSSTSRRFSADESVTSSRRCQRSDALSFLGFVPLQGPSGGASSDFERRPVQAGFSRVGIRTARTPLRTSSSAGGRARPRAVEDAGIA
jgi:hypothetical protein